MTVVGLYRRAGLRSALTSRYSPRVLGDESAARSLGGGGVETVLSMTIAAAHLDADSVVLTARHGPVVAGFAIMRYGDERAHLNLLAVDPEHRRRGIGHAQHGAQRRYGPGRSDGRQRRRPGKAAP